MGSKRYDYEAIERMHYDEGLSWEECARRVGAPTAHNGMSLRTGYYKWRDRTGRPKRTERSISAAAITAEPGAPIVEDDEGTLVEKSGTSKHRITTLAELFEFFEIPFRWEHGADCACREADGQTFIDPEHCPYAVPVSDDYEVVSFKVNSWEQHSVKKGVVTLYQVKATLRPKEAVESREVMEQVWADFRADAEAHDPDWSLNAPRPWVLQKKEVESSGQLLELALVDPHLGMLAWGKEVGIPYDLEIGIRDYRRAFSNLLGMGERYNIERVLLLVGNDLFHVDGPGFDAKGGSRGGATTKGTMQDLDTRLARLFTHVRRLVVDCIDEARNEYPVTVQIVPGNHDRHTMYKFGEVLQAWYRNDEHVEIRNTPSVRDYYLYGKNLFMFTHGEEFERKRDNLVSVFATECPPEMWVQGRVREVHLGHNHINKQKIYRGDPLEEVWEGRATRVRSLPGLTPEDSWHFESGYKHQRRASALVWYREGGLAGLHEFTV